MAREKRPLWERAVRGAARMLVEEYRPSEEELRAREEERKRQEKLEQRRKRRRGLRIIGLILLGLFLLLFLIPWLFRLYLPEEGFWGEVKSISGNYLDFASRAFSWIGETLGGMIESIKGNASETDTPLVTPTSLTP